jgi:hypothetical protein
MPAPRCPAHVDEQVGQLELLQLPQDDRVAIAAILADSIEPEPTSELEAAA